MRHIRNTGQVGQIKNALMGLAVAAHQSCPVNGKNYMQVLDTDVMQHLIVGALQERGINRYHRLQAACRQTCRKGYGVLLRDSHVEKPIREHIFKALEAGSVRHGRRNGHHLLVPIAQLPHHCGKDIRIIGLGPSVLGQTCLNLRKAPRRGTGTDDAPPAHSPYLFSYRRESAPRDALFLRR